MYLELIDGKRVPIFKGDLIVEVAERPVYWTIDEITPLAHYGELALPMQPSLIHPVLVKIRRLKRKDIDTQFDPALGQRVHIAGYRDIPAEATYEQDELAYGQIRYENSDRVSPGVGGDNGESDGHITFLNAGDNQDARMFKADFTKRRKTTPGVG